MKRKRKKPETKEAFHKKYNFELYLFFMLSLGIFLLVEDMEISHNLYNFGKLVLFLLADTVKLIRNIIIDFFTKFELSDLVGITLISIVIYLLTIRWRYRLLNQFQKITHCPKCEEKLKRIPKKINYRILSFILSLRIYFFQCSECYKVYYSFLEKSRGN